MSRLSLTCLGVAGLLAWGAASGIAWAQASRLLGLSDPTRPPAGLAG